MEKESVVESPYICDGIAGNLAESSDAPDISLTDEMVERIVKRLHGTFQVQENRKLVPGERFQSLGTSQDDKNVPAVFVFEVRALLGVQVSERGLGRAPRLPIIPVGILDKPPGQDNAQVVEAIAVAGRMVEEHGTEEIKVKIVAKYPVFQVSAGYGGSIQCNQCRKKFKGFRQSIVQLLIIIEINHAMERGKGGIPIGGAIGSRMGLGGFTGDFRPFQGLLKGVWYQGGERGWRQKNFMAQQFYGVCRGEHKRKASDLFKEELMKETASAHIICELNCGG